MAFIGLLTLLAACSTVLGSPVPSEGFDNGTIAKVKVNLATIATHRCVCLRLSPAFCRLSLHPVQLGDWYRTGNSDGAGVAAVVRLLRDRPSSRPASHSQSAQSTQHDATGAVL